MLLHYLVKLENYSCCWFTYCTKIKQIITKILFTNCPCNCCFLIVTADELADNYNWINYNYGTFSITHPWLEVNVCTPLSYRISTPVRSLTYWNMSLTSISPPGKVVLPADTATSLTLGGAPRTSLMRTEDVMTWTALVHVIPVSPHGTFFVVTANDSWEFVRFVRTRMYSQSPCTTTHRGGNRDKPRIYCLGDYNPESRRPR